MALHYTDLDDDLRQIMTAELDNHPRYVSSQILPARLADWDASLRLAAESESDAWLEERILADGYLEDFSRPDKNGVVRQINKPAGAKMLAEGQFGSYYARAVCVRATQLGKDTVRIYRAKESLNPRPRSVELEDTEIGANALLDALRAHDFAAIDAAFGMPLPNSGLSIQIID